MFSWFKSRKVSIERAMAGADPTPPPIPLPPTLQEFEALLEANDLPRALETSSKLADEQRSGAHYLRLEGWLMYELGNLDGARKLLEQALQLEARVAHCHALLAAIHMRQGQATQAEERALESESLGGKYPWLRSMLGVLHHGRGEVQQARDWFERALVLDPTRRDALESLAGIAFSAGEWEALLAVSRRLVTSHPDIPTGWSYLGTAEARAGSDEEAERCLVRNMELNTSTVDGQRDYASFLTNCGRVEEAKLCLERALERDPNHALLHTAHAQCRLILEGSAVDAWREYEWRLRLPGVAPQATGERWDGQPLEREELRISGEQGYGDLLLFARMLPEVTRRCQRAIVELPLPLVPLFDESSARFNWRGLEVVEIGSPRGQGSQPIRHLPFMSLMNVLGPALPAPDAPYLLPSDEREFEWRRRLGSKPQRLRVAIVWAGNPLREDDVLRSIPPQALAPLAAVRDVEFISLQKDAKPKYFREMPLRMLDITGELRDFADSAAVIRQCDLLISIDTAAAHLAGACGVPCWVLLPLVRDWRWEMGGVDQPWYPLHRTFRVCRNRDWGPLLESVAVELSAMATRTT